MKIERSQIISILQSRIPTLQCPMCKGKSFSIIDGCLIDLPQEDYKQIILSKGPCIPSIGLACNGCGFISRHALGVLGLMENGDSTTRNDTP